MNEDYERRMFSAMIVALAVVVLLLTVAWAMQQGVI